VVYVEDVEKIVRLAKEVMLAAGSHGPTVYLRGSDGKVAIGLEDFGENKQLELINAGTWTALKHNVGELQLLIFVCEGWMSQNLGIRPSEDPKRIEVLIINVLDVATQEEQVIQFEIVRNKAKKVIDLREPDVPRTDSVKGRLLPAFQKGYQIVQPTFN
jgi:hypothetical protein